MAIAVLLAICVSLGVLLRQARYEINLQRKTIQDWSDNADWMRAQHQTATSNLNSTIDRMQKDAASGPK